MPSDTVIKVENLSKLYRIGTREAGYRTLRDTITDVAIAPFKRLKGAWSKGRGSWSQSTNSPLHTPSSKLSSSDDTIWALKDVSFEVKRGEVVGIIGRNGAGKSTLLKILSRITEPTEGRIEMRGRVGSLLEVGTGFHPELTGHENVYLYGAILGMDRWEITRKFDEIVAFSEVEKFINTPVKRYSSGMYMRLAFAVAAHLEPEILLIDEVLAVGDAAFQKKCLNKMDTVSKHGRTILFVSHNMKVISTLCRQGIYIDNGEILRSGKAVDIIKEYLANISQRTIRRTVSIEPEPGLPFSVCCVSTCDSVGKVKDVFRRSGRVEVRIGLNVTEISEKLLVAIDVRAIDDTLLFRTHSFENPKLFEMTRKMGQYDLICTFPENLFPAGTYRLGIISALAGKKELQNIYPVLEFDIVQDELLGKMFTSTVGMLTPMCVWKRE